MTVVLANAAYCYDRVNYIIMSLVWLVLTNGNIPAIVTALLCLQTMKFFQKTGFGESKTYFGGTDHRPYMMGLGQGNRAAPPSWIPLSAVLVSVFKQLELGALLLDSITLEMIHTMGALFVDDTDLYTWRDGLLDPGEPWRQTQVNSHQWSCLLKATGGALKPENDSGTCLTIRARTGSDCMQRWRCTNCSSQIQMDPGVPSHDVTESKKTVGIHNLPAGGNEGHLKHIQEKATMWTSRMTNGHLLHYMAWVAYRHQPWPGL
jgi:hypothetical protein